MNLNKKKSNIDLTTTRVSVYEDYASLKKRCLYNIASEGYDYYVIRSHGKNIQVPKKLVNFYPIIEERETKEDEDDWSEYLEKYNMDSV